MTSRKQLSTNTVVIGSDHGGFRTKQVVIRTLARHGYTIVDVGGFSGTTPDDYPTFAAQAAKEVRSDKSGQLKAILICGSGTGMAIAANKFPGIRAAFAYDAYSAKMARHDNDANILALRGRNFPAASAARIALLFLKTPFSGIPRHKRRIGEITRLERKK